MKKCINIILAIMFFATIYSYNNRIENNRLRIKESNEQKIKVYYSSLSIGVFSGLNLGYGKVAKNNNTKEHIWIIHAAGLLPNYLSDHLFVIGLYYQTNYFKNPDRKGFFLKTDIGIDYFKMPQPPFDPGGSNSGKKDFEMIFPNVTFAKYDEKKSENK